MALKEEAASYFPPFLLPAGWNADVLARAETAILNHEVNLRNKAQHSGAVRYKKPRELAKLRLNTVPPKTV